jgi:uncharacterized integral membrane protein
VQALSEQLSPGGVSAAVFIEHPCRERRTRSKVRHVSSDSTPEGAQGHGEVVADSGRSLTPKQISAGIVVVVVVVFALLNLQDVTTHWIVGTTHTPLIALVCACLLIGVGIGYAIARRRTQRQRSPTDA